MGNFCKILFGLLLAAESLADRIPYSYASGRDVDRVERRAAAFATAKSAGAGAKELNDICGPAPEAALINFNEAVCSVPGRPSDEYTFYCDTICCLKGFKVGNCGRNGCACSNDFRDVKCGPDGSWNGIRCPFDSSACWRKCCRDGKSGGKCGGFLKTKCKCN